MLGSRWPPLQKLSPIVSAHQTALTDVRGEYWSYYTELLKYKKAPTVEQKTRLDKEFDKVFSTATGYDDLDDRITKTLAKKAELLLVLNTPSCHCITMLPNLVPEYRHVYAM